MDKSKEALLNHLYLASASSVRDQDFLGNALVELVHMGDDAHQAVTLRQLVEHLQRLVQVAVAERAEALVDEQRVELSAPARF